jgi:hypothetical protein
MERSFDKLILQTMALAESQQIPLSELIARFEQLAPEICEQIIDHVMERIKLPIALSDAQRLEVRAVCIEKFRNLFLSQVSVAHSLLARADSLAPN